MVPFQTLLAVMRRGSLSAAEEITGHKYETIDRWLRMAAQHAEALTEVLVHDLHLSEVEVDAFWSFVKKVSGGWRSRRLGGRGGPAFLSQDRATRFVVTWGFGG